MHQVGLHKVRVFWVDPTWIGALLNVLVCVPAQVFVHHVEHQEHVLVHVVSRGLGKRLDLIVGLLQDSCARGEMWDTEKKCRPRLKMLHIYEVKQWVRGNFKDMATC